MQNHLIWHLITKDLREIFRNKRALISGLLLPALFIPFILFFQNLFIPHQTTEKTNLVIYDYRINNKSTIKSLELLVKEKDFVITNIYRNSKTNFDVHYDLSIVIHDNFNNKNNINFFYSSLNPKSVSAYQKISEIFLQNEVKELSFDFTDLNKDSSNSNPVPDNQNNPLSNFPWLLLMFGFSGAAFVSSEIITGEKERHTLETLFAMQIPRPTILYAKFITVFLFSIINLLFNLLVMTFSVYFIYQNLTLNFFYQMLEMLFLVLPAFLLLSTILLHFALRAKSIHESRSHESIFFIVFSLTIISTSFINLDPVYYLNLIPFVNTIIILKGSLSTIPYLSLALYFFIYLYLSFSLLYKNKKYILTDEVLNLNSQNNPNKQSIKLYIPVLVSLAIYLFLQYCGNFFLKTDEFYGVLISQIVIFLFPALILLYFTRKTHKWSFIKHTPKLKYIVLTPLISFLFFIILNIIQQYVYQYIFKGVLNPDTTSQVFNSAELLKNLIFLSLCPAICEEFLFRAYIFSSYLKFDTKKAIVISALIFTIFHQNYAEYAALFTLGLWFAFILYKSGNIFLTIFAHFINNALVALNNYYNIQIFKAEILSENTILLMLFGSLISLFILLKIFNRGSL